MGIKRLFRRLTRAGAALRVEANGVDIEDERVRDLIRTTVILAGGSLCAWCEGFGRRVDGDGERDGIRLGGDGGATE